MDGVFGGDWAVSKKYKGKDCAYCGKVGASDTADHVVASSFFLIEDQGNLPKVPSCGPCNNQKSKLEHYVSAAFLAGSQLHEDGRYVRELVVPRLAKNKKQMAEVGFFNPPVWINSDGLPRLALELKVDAAKLLQLMALVVKGLYCFHFQKPLDTRFCPEVFVLPPDKVAASLAPFAQYITHTSPRISGDIGNGSFRYEGVRSDAYEAFSIWSMGFHNGIPLHGAGSPPQGIATFLSVTVPTAEACARKIADSTHT